MPLTRRDVVFFMAYAGPLLAAHAGMRSGVTGGAETQIVLLARELERRSHRVAIATIDVASGLPRFVDGIEVIALPARPTTGSRRDLALWRLRLVASLVRVDGGVFVQRGAGSITGLVGLLSWLRRRPFVYSSSSVMDFESPRMGRFEARLLRIGIRIARNIVVQSDEQVELCARHWGRPSIVIRSLAEPASARAAVPEAFLWIGRLAPYKRPDAFAELAARIPAARFWMVGTPSPHDPRAPERVSQAPNVELLQTRPRAELAPLFERAVAVVSTSESEGMPNVFLEAWARGVPALALSCDPDGLIERHGLGWHAGGSPERFAELAAAAWAERHDHAEVAARCRDYIAREHDPQRVTDRWEQALRLSAPAAWRPPPDACATERGGPGAPACPRPRP